MSDVKFPAIGHTYRADYGELAYRVAFADDGKTLRWAEDKATDFGAAAKTETYQAIPIRPASSWSPGGKRTARLSPMSRTSKTAPFTPPSRFQTIHS
ncbi:hypothetical protein [Rhizobium sp. ICMP 5592]|uniref:hypothetical protein n=1 Tax=Rhizobium sp. ICMP 5592 TaxID=2292445 RepID=UPI001296CC5B|nr:hypothetical protein [Rhizobium sp. ICMP 5592]MQB44798.1 hypothetical protein [Rhizobium sp. ICMP 5592]